MTPSPAEIEYYTACLLYRCAGCYKSLNNNVKTVVMDRMDYTVLEEKLICINCGVQVDYWAHGHWEGKHYRQQFEQQHPKAAELIQKMVEVSKEMK